MDISALMGYTGAMFKDFLGSNAGLLYTLGIMVVWVVAPLLLALRSFNKKDL
jgi:Cu-processing system permease protein